MYIPRSLEPTLRRASRQFPAVVLLGPRQSGKTTLLRHALQGRVRHYVSLETSDVRAAALADPRGFLLAHPPPVIFDEIHNAPDLLPYIKEAIDAGRDQCGRFFLTGSQNLLLSQHVTESLAGRAAMLRLLPLSFRELSASPDQPFAWEKQKAEKSRSTAGKPLWPSILRGGYPEVARDPKRDAFLWHSSYVQTYLERDVRALRQIGDLAQFQVFLRALAARNSQILDLSGLSRDIGVAVNTAKAWLSVLQATWQVFLLPPWHENAGKRLVKSPKVYFGDTGTLCYLAGLRDTAHAAAGPMGGSLFETAVVTEVFRTLTHRGEDPRVYFWRTSAGVEVDLVVDTGSELIPIEVKLSQTPKPEMAKGIEAFRRTYPGRAATGYVVHPGDLELPLGPDAKALPFARL